MKHGKKKKKKNYKWVPWALGIGTAGLVAYILLRPKTASAGQLNQSTPPIIPGPGNIQITVGSKVPLTAMLTAHNLATGDTVNVPGATVITVEKLDADGTLWFRYNAQLLSSPVEEYSAVVAAPLN